VYNLSSFYYGNIGQIIFAMYVVPPEQVVLIRGARCHQYADDNQLYMRLTPGHITLSDLGKCAISAARWFLLKGLMVNPSKTEHFLWYYKTF